MRLFDVLVVVGGLWAVCHAYGMEWADQYTTAAACALGLYLLIAENKALYRSWRSGGLWQEATEVVVVWTTMAIALLVLGYVTRTSADFSRRVLLTWSAGGPAVLIASRIVIRWLARAVREGGRNHRSAAIAGVGELGRHVAETIRSEPWMGLKLVGLYSDRGCGEESGEGDLAHEISGSLEDLVAEARKGEIDVIYVALPMQAEASIRRLVRQLSSTVASVYFVPDLVAFAMLRSRWFTLGAIPTISLFDRPLSASERMLKRIEDTVLAALALSIAGIPMLLIGLCVKWTSPGPMIFKQRRYGLDGREIVVWKFRTMTVCEDGAAFRQARRSDPRVTRFGALLRAASLDELPQFINVLQGRMSVVGPRPHPVLLDEQHRDLIDWYMLRQRVKPGITGWAQVNGFRGETGTLEKMKERIEHDLQYIRNWSIGLDLKIVALTLFNGLVGKNAY
jgi:putative colanic acid biosynthesis UDP-glucose lipid carrier transferase